MTSSGSPAVRTKRAPVASVSRKSTRPLKATDSKRAPGILTPGSRTSRASAKRITARLKSASRPRTPPRVQSSIDMPTPEVRSTTTSSQVESRNFVPSRTASVRSMSERVTDANELPVRSSRDHEPPTARVSRHCVSRAVAPSRRAPSRITASMSAPSRQASERSASCRTVLLSPAPSSRTPRIDAPMRLVPSRPASRRSAPSRSAPSRMAPSRQRPRRSLPLRSAPTRPTPTMRPVLRSSSVRESSSAERLDAGAPGSWARTGSSDTDKTSAMYHRPRGAADPRAAARP